MTTMASLPAQIAIAIALVLAVVSGANAQGVSIQASAGLAGYVKPGRWAPVQVDVTSGSRQLTGELVVEWGPARVHRAITLTAGLSRHLELYVRTLDPRDLITVRLLSDGVTLTEALVPVHVLAHDASTPPLVVCGPQAQAREVGCVAGVDMTSLPHSWRGFDAADDVRLSEDEIGALDARQRSAFELASAQARLFRLGLGAPTLGPVPTERRSTRRSLVLLGSYALALLVSLWAVRYRPSATLATIATCGVIGSVAVIAAGRVGPGASLLIHHAASLDQYEGTASAVFTMRGVAEFPTLGQYALQSDLEDASILVQADHREDSATIDSSGFPVLAGRFGLGSTMAFVLEGAASPALLRVTRDDRRVQVTNVSTRILRRCAFSATPSAVTAELPPGGVALGTTSDEDVDPLFTCVLESSPWGLSEPRHPVMMDGETTVVVHLTPA
jgi:hypothetical protein